MKLYAYDLNQIQGQIRKTTLYQCRNAHCSPCVDVSRRGNHSQRVA